MVDPQFGRAIMVGLGGVLADVYRDVAFRLVPLSPVDAEEMLVDLRAQTLLTGLRGRPAVDRRRLASVLLGVSRLVADHPEITELDLNPIICRGEDIVVADARARIEMLFAEPVGCILDNRGNLEGAQLTVSPALTNASHGLVLPCAHRTSCLTRNITKPSRRVNAAPWPADAPNSGMAPAADERVETRVRCHDTLEVRS